MKKTLVASLVAVSLGVASVAAAADFSGFAGKGSGFYVGGNLGYAHADWRAANLATTAIPVDTVSNKSGLTYGLDVGYMFNANVGMEVAYDMYRKNDLKAAGSKVGQVKSQNYPSVLSVLNIPVSNQWNVFAKLGATYLSPSVDYTGDSDIKLKVWAPTMALGAGYNLTQNLNLNTQFKYISKVSNVAQVAGDPDATLTPNYTALTVGVNYKF